MQKDLLKLKILKTLKYNLKATTEQLVMRKIFGLSCILTILLVIPTVQYVLAAGDAPGEYIDRRVEIWNLFFRLMTVAFVIGAVVSGTLIWLVWRFRESNPKAKPTKYEEAGEW
jgi:heme/copper-type cytochrome/quinol oxidase subunit 2